MIKLKILKIQYSKIKEVFIGQHGKRSFKNIKFNHDKFSISKKKNRFKGKLAL